VSTYTQITAIIKVKGPIDEVYELEDCIKELFGDNLEILFNYTSIAEVTDTWEHKGKVMI